MKEHSVLFWDFDGVIKESVEIKTAAFVRLFERYGSEFIERVRAHHESNAGMSRIEKIPLYLRWAGVSPTPQEVLRYCAAFSDAVRAQVIEASWVPGAREYLLGNRARQRFVLLSATPQAEMEYILAALGIADCFREVHGAPTSKVEAIRSVLRRWSCAPNEGLMIGDSRSDYDAAMATGLAFLLRRTPQNRDLQAQYSGAQCENFCDE